MQERETLSAYMDGHDVDAKFSETLCKSEELQQKWANYHTIRSVMRGEEQLLGADFSAKMAMLIEDEEIDKTTVSSEQSAKPRGLMFKLKRWSVPVMQVGIAASVCLTAVVGFNLINQTEEVVQADQPVLQTLPFSNSVQPVSYNAPAQAQPTQEQLEYQQRRLNALLQNHELQRRTEQKNANGVVLTEEEKQKAQTSNTDVKQEPKSE